MLAWTIYSSFLGALAVLLIPERQRMMSRWIALGTAGLGLVLGLFGAVEFGGGPIVQTIVEQRWIAVLGIDFTLAVDGISIVLVLLTGLAAVSGVLISWNVEHRIKEYYAFYLTLIGGVYGVFLSFDLFLLFVFYEIAIVPKYFLIAIWGSTRREYGAMKLALYSFVGSALVLIGIIAAYVVSGVFSFDIRDLAAAEFSMAFQIWAFPLVFVGFAILAGLWPFHTWAPTGHVAAPTAASMLLAGVVMKLGAYGALRVAMTLFPQGLLYWQDTLAGLAVVGIVYGAMVALTQKDFKFVIGYSSVSHMGFVLLGMASLNLIGLSGAVLQMFSHGIIAGLLFAVVGRMVYERTHTRNIDELKYMKLRAKMPSVAMVFTVAGLASMGMPGFSGFVAELQVIIGAWQAFPMFSVLAGVGIVIGVCYTLKTIQLVFYNEDDDSQPLPDTEAAEEVGAMTLPEKIAAWMLMLTSLLVGLYPRILLDLINPAFQTPLFEGLRKAANW